MCVSKRGRIKTCGAALMQAALGLMSIHLRPLTRSFRSRYTNAARKTLGAATRLPSGSCSSGRCEWALASKLGSNGAHFKSGTFSLSQFQIRKRLRDKWECWRCARGPCSGGSRGRGAAGGGCGRWGTDARWRSRGGVFAGWWW